MRSPARTAVIAFCGFVAASFPAYADILYSDGPPGSGAWAINNAASGPASATADSFILGGGSTVQDITFANWVSVGDTPDTLNWVISSALGGGGTVYGSGSEVPLTVLSSQTSGISGYLLDQVTFSTGDIALPSGTYWLELLNESTAKNLVGYWGEANQAMAGPSQAWQSYYGTIPSEAFQVEGVAVPEPSSLALLLGGLALLGSYRLRRRKRAIREL